MQIKIGVKTVLALTPLWVWIGNGYSTHGGVDDGPTSFGLGFIGTFLSTSAVIGEAHRKANEETKDMYGAFWK